MNNKKFTLRALFAFLAILGVMSFRVTAQTPDPGTMGPHAVVKVEYDLGDAYFAAVPPTFPWTMECRGSVHYPADLTSGPFPVLVWLHGRHSTCYDPSTLSSSLTWPCTGSTVPITSYEGYDYAAKTMASHGYIVISISANSVNAHDAGSSDLGMTARGHLVQNHLDLWNGWNTTVTTGPFGSLFVGRLDLQNIGTMGHSRGGEGVVFNAEYNRSLGSPYGIKAVLTLAPVDFYRHVLNGIALMDIAPYCDGDVSDLQGVHFYDNIRYSDTTDETGKHTVLVMGANHNYFNTVWTPFSYPAGGADDWLYTGGPTDAYCGASAPGTGRLDTTHQKAVYNTYSAAFYRYYLGHETAFAPILYTEDLKPPASALVDSSKIFISNHPGRTLRHDLNRMDSTTDTAFNTLHGPVTNSGLVSYNICGGGLTMTSCGIGTQAQEPHKGSGSYPGVEQVKLRWNSPTQWYQNEIPHGYGDLTGYRCLQFRAAVNYLESSAGPNTDFTVQLIDSFGAIASQAVSAHTFAMFYEPGTTASDLPKVCFNTIRLPLSSFTGINMTKVRYVKFLFNRSATGSIDMSDLAFVEQDCGKLNSSFTHSIISGFNVGFTNTSLLNNGDTVKYLWNFGEIASGLNDTSSLANPTHLYLASGAYTACLYITSKRRNGTICYDTLCTTVAVGTALGTQAQAEPTITIIPNPAKDHLQIIGAGKADVLKLFNVYGQEVFSAVISQDIISLPPQLANGLYYAAVISPKGNYYQKVLISR